MTLNNIVQNRINFKNILAAIGESFDSASFLFICKDMSLSKVYANLIAQKLVNEKYKVEHGSHPDVKEFCKNNESFLTENAKAMIEDISFKPLEADKKVYFIYNADKLSLEVQNKLLKTLEEPPRGNFIFFIAPTEENLLPTIKSRLSKLEVTNLTAEEFNTYFFANPKANELYYKSNGNLEIAILLNENKNYLTNYENALNILERMQSSKDVINFRGFFKKDNTMDMLNIFKLLFTILIDKEKAKQVFTNSVLEDFNLPTIMGVIEVLNKAEQKLKANCNLTAVMDCFLIELLEVKHKWKNL